MDFFFNKKTVLHPRLLKQRDWDEVKKNAEVLVKDYGFQYVKACIIAYLNFFEADVEQLH